MKLKFEAQFKGLVLTAEDEMGWEETLVLPAYKATFDITYKISDNNTLVYGTVLEDNGTRHSISGYTVLHPNDTYDKKLGLKLALRKALDYQFTKREVHDFMSAFRKALRDKEAE